jgi:hypothetical protein
MKASTPKTKKTEKKPEVIYTRMIKAYFYKAFETLEPGIKEDSIPESMEALPAKIFLEGIPAEKDIYYDPAPRSLKLIVHMVVTVHNHILECINTGNPEFINLLLTIPDTKIPALNDEPEPKKEVFATFGQRSYATKSNISGDQAANAMQKFTKAIVEAMVNCVVINKHLPGTKTYLPQLCQAAGLPHQIIQFVRSIPPPPVTHKKSAAAADDASAAPAAAPPVAAPVEEGDDD